MEVERVGEYTGRRGAARATVFAAVLAAAPCGAEPFVGQFELKTLESDRGRFEFQSQNARSWGQPVRGIADGPDGLLFDENAVTRERYALELEMGFSRRVKMRIGAEFERERVDDPAGVAQANDFGDLEIAELGVEVIAVIAPREGDGAGLGVVVELEGPVDGKESSHIVVGPIVEFESGPWFAATVPMLVYAFGGDTEDGERTDDKWDFAYAAQLTYTWSARWALAVEAYGTVERLGSTGRPSDAARRFGDFDQHRMGPVLYYTRRVGDGAAREPMDLTVGLGLLAGLNGDTPEHTVKLSVELEF